MGNKPNDDVNVAASLREHDLEELKADLSGCAEKAEELLTFLRGALPLAKDLPAVGAEDLTTLKACERFTGALTQVLVLLATRVRLEVSND